MITQIEDLNRYCLKISRPYLSYFHTKSNTVGPDRFIVLNDSADPKMVTQIYFNFFLFRYLTRKYLNFSFFYQKQSRFLLNSIFFSIKAEYILIAVDVIFSIKNITIYKIAPFEKK